MKKKIMLFGALGIILLLVLGFTDSDNRFQYIFKRLHQYSTEEGPEKIYLHTDKQFYTTGETIWIKSYLVDGITHTSSSKSKVSYIELINAKDSIVARRTIYTGDVGSSADIHIDKHWPSGNYMLRSYTNYMRNKKPIFFQKDLFIWHQIINPEDISQPEEEIIVELPDSLLPSKRQIELKSMKPSIKFYPEGGDLISGLQNTLGIHATDANGNGIQVSGSIKDEKGKDVAFFKTYNYGLGKIAFNPKPNKKYIASIGINNKRVEYPIPEALKKGYKLGVRNNEDHIILDVQSTAKESLQGTLLMGHIRGKLFFKHIELDKKEKYSIKLLTEKIDDGVAHFTLFKPSGEAVSERLIFVDNPENDIKLTMNTNKEEYTNREQVSIDVSVADIKGNSVNGDFSLSVISSDSLDKNSATSDIRSWLLLDSDLKGTIENPGYFFEDDGKTNKKYLLDALMLTHGWRRFVWKEFLQTNKMKNEFLPEKGLFVTGKTTILDKPFATKRTLAKISFLGKEKGVYQEESYTNHQGRFSFGPFVFRDTISAVMEATFPEAKNEAKKKNISIFIDAPLSGPEVVRFEKKKQSVINYEYLQQYLEEAKRKKIIDFKYNPEVTILDDVILKTKRKKFADKLRDEIREITIYDEPVNRLFPDSIPGAGSLGVIDLLRQVPGVNVFGSFSNQRIEIRGGTLGNSPSLNFSSNPAFQFQQQIASPFSVTSAPLILIDGVEVTLDFIYQMLASEVSFIDVLKGNEAVVFGSKGNNGVISIYTYRGFNFSERQIRSPGVTNFDFPAFYQTKEFFTPDYSTKKPEHYIPDYRTTLHWEPHIRTEGDKKATVKFYTSDNTGKYLIKIEGLTDDGRVIKTVKEIHVLE